MHEMNKEELVADMLKRLRGVRWNVHCLRSHDVPELEVLSDAVESAIARVTRIGLPIPDRLAVHA